MNHFKKIAGVLEAHGLDAVLLTCEANRFYASGFHSSGTDGVAIVTRNRSYYFTDSRYTEAAARYVQGAEIRQTDREHPYSALINEVIEKEHITRMGYEDEYMTAADFRRFSEKLHCELVPATELLWTLRAVKDEDKSFDPIVVSGPNGSLPHGVPSEKPIQAGEFVTMDFGCKFGGYCSDMTRTVAVGHVTEEMETVYNTVLKAQLAGIAAAKAGVTGAAVDGAARQVIADAGYGPYFGHSFGHSVGVEIHENPNATPSNSKPLPAGAVISAEPGIYLPGKLGVRIEDVIVITEQGCQDITLAPKELLIL